MTTTVTTKDSSGALTAVLAEADAHVCRNCGICAAVRVSAQPALPDALSERNVVWFCFECGHEERASS
jgi:hypothetical protein